MTVTDMNFFFHSNIIHWMYCDKILLLQFFSLNNSSLNNSPLKNYFSQLIIQINIFIYFLCKLCIFMISVYFNFTLGLWHLFSNDIRNFIFSWVQMGNFLFLSCHEHLR